MRQASSACIKYRPLKKAAHARRRAERADASAACANSFYDDAEAALFARTISHMGFSHDEHAAYVLQHIPRFAYRADTPASKMMPGRGA